MPKRTTFYRPMPGIKRDRLCQVMRNLFLWETCPHFFFVCENTNKIDFSFSNRASKDACFHSCVDVANVRCIGIG